MDREEIEEILDGLPEVVTAHVLTREFGYKSQSSITRACQDGRIPGAYKMGGIWMIPASGIRKAIEQGTLRPGWKDGA
jgi:hypothetical protein